MLIILGLVILFLIAAMLAWSSVRAWRSKNRLLKWGGAGSASLLALVVSVVIVLIGGGVLKLNMRTAPVPAVKVEGTPGQIQRGRAIADSFCGACHSKTGTLTGGEDIGEHFPIRIGSLVAANLTPAGQLRNWSDGQIFRAIRNGIDANGHWLVVMSYTNAGKLSDEDTEALIAYIRSQPAAGETTPDPPDRLNPLGLMMLGAGMLPTGKPVFSGTIKAPPHGPTAQYGEYILSFQDCRECHGADLRGGVQGQLPPVGPGLGLVKNWKLEDFISTLRTGIDPTGHELGKQMPWRPIGKMSDEELTAVYEYLTQLPGL
jgi:mono/diheme cytochrome c family protein